MRLNEFLAAEKTRVFESVLAGSKPEGARCDEALLRALHEKGRATMGTTVLKPWLISFEFVFSMDDGQTEVLAIELDPPERIVHMPVPEWVVENVWQGDVQGSYQFESDAAALVAGFSGELGVEANAKWFERQQPKRRE